MVHAGRPTTAEHIPYYGRYIDLVPDGDVIALLSRQIAATGAICAQLSPQEAARRPATGEWHAIEIVGHLADAERVLAYRALRLARGDEAQPENVEFEDYAVAAGYGERDLASVVAEFAATRAATVAFLAGLSSAAWARRAPETWPCRSVRGFAYTIAGHELHHLPNLRAARADTR